MKNKDRTIKVATFAELDKKITLGRFQIDRAVHTVASYFGRNSQITRSWRLALKEIRQLQLDTRQSFRKKISG